MSEAHRSPTSPTTARVPGRRHAVLLAITSALTVMLAAVSLAGAQAPVDQGCPFGAICHPMGEGMQFMDGMTAAADAVGRLFNSRRNSGDCTGLGPDGCLGLVLHKVMCAIDGREWVQEYACGEGGGGGGGDGAAAEAQASTSSPPVYVVSREAATWLLRTMLAHTSDRPFRAIKLGDVGGFDFFLRGVYAFDERNQSEYFGVLEAVDSTTGRSAQLMLGAVSDHVYAGHIDFFKALR